MDEEEKITEFINENKTRKKYIDPELEKRDWLKKYIKEEINSVKSDFVNKKFVFYDGHPEKNVDRFVDYVLLDEDYSVLAIIEAKRFSKDEEKGRIQARTYAKDIEKQIEKKIPIFLTNGRKWLLIDEDGIERKVSGPFNQEDLKRRCNLYSNRRNPTEVKISSRIVDRAKKAIPNISAFVQDMFERELAGEFNQLKIDEAEKKLELLKSQQSQIQTKKQEQKILSDANLKEILDEQQAESRAWREKDRKKPREG